MKFNLKIKKFLFVLFILGLLFQPVFVFAEEGFVPCDGTEDDPCDMCLFFKMVKKIIDWATKIALLVGAALLIAGGVWMMVAGAAGGVEKGRTIVTYSIVGLLIIMGAWLLVHTLIVVINPDNTGTFEMDGIDPFTWYKLDCEKINEKFPQIQDVDLPGGEESGSGAEEETGILDPATGEGD